MSYAQRVSARRRAVLLRRARRAALVVLGVAVLLVSEVSLITQLVDRGESAEVVRRGGPEAAAALMPVPVIVQAEATDPPGGCGEEGLDRKDPAALIDAFGDATAMRDAFLAGKAPCVRLDDPALPWVVVNKQRPIDPIRYAPDRLEVPEHALAGSLRADVVDSFEQLLSAAADAGAGRMALASGYRSYDDQVASYESQVGARGREDADALSAHPGFSEHQLGLAADVVACGDDGCGEIYEFGGTRQAAWLAENSWRFGWIVRYEKGQAATTGYNPEPWHLRYIGVELAEVYHESGHRTLEEFFGLPAAPDYD